MKQRLANFLRSTRALHLSDLLRYRWHYYKNYSKNATFLKNNKGEQFPLPYMIYETFKMDYERYFISGRETAKWITEEVTEFIDLKDAKVLDWGCGPGRVIRHLPKLLGSEAQLFGCDYNNTYVQWCQEHLKDIKFYHNLLEPPLPFEENSFDLVYALSIFTHLSEEKHKLWISEIARILKPGGLFFFTTHGEVTKQNLLPNELELFEKGQLVVRDKVKEGHRMYVAYHPGTFINTLIAPYAQVLKHTPGKMQNWGAQQDTWIIKKH